MAIRRRPLLIARVVYLVLVLVGALVLWLLVPADVKQAIYDAYFRGG